VVQGAKDVVIQPDGKIVAVGDQQDPYVWDVVRLNSNGSFDTSFGGTGIVRTTFGTYATGVALQADGKIVVAGDDSPHSLPTVLARFNTDGSLDTTFNGTGVFTGTAGGALTDVAIQPADGKIVTVGNVGGYPNND